MLEESYYYFNNATNILGLSGKIKEILIGQPIYTIRRLTKFSTFQGPIY